MLTFDLLTFKLVSESRVTWATSVPTSVLLGLSVLDLGPVFATDVRQHHRLMPPPYRDGGIINQQYWFGWSLHSVLQHIKNTMELQRFAFGKQNCHFPLTCCVTLTTVYAPPCETVMKRRPLCVVDTQPWLSSVLIQFPTSCSLLRRANGDSQ